MCNTKMHLYAYMCYVLMLFFAPCSDEMTIATISLPIAAQIPISVTIPVIMPDEYCESESTQELFIASQVNASFEFCWSNSTNVENMISFQVPSQHITEKDVHFELYTRNTNYTPEIFTIDNVETTIKSSSFNASKQTIIYLRGSRRSVKFAVKPFVAGVLPKEDVNIILCNWDSYVYYHDTYHARYTTPRLGRIAAIFTHKLMNATGLDPKNIYYIGFSIGAQSLALAAKTIRPRIGKMLAIDPQGNCFNLLPDTEKLNVEDADFVQVIHCTVGVLGAPLDVLGTATFYVNGGYIQPNCTSCIVKETNKCSHRVCLDYFFRTLHDFNHYEAVKCNSYEDFNNRTCDCNDTAIMGYATPTTTRGTYYINTVPDNQICPGDENNINVTSVDVQ